MKVDAAKKMEAGDDTAISLLLISSKLMMQNRRAWNKPGDDAANSCKQ